jgi:hypothetical protein
LIPFLLIAMDYPFRSPEPRASEPRASDTDRDTTVDILCAAVADGRLTLAELDQRTEAALSARTLTELATLIADLAHLPYLPDPLSAPAPVVRKRAVPPLGELTARRWALLQSIADAARHPSLGLS